MDSVSSVAAFSTAQAAANVQSQVGIKVLKLAQDQQKSVASLIDSAVEAASQIAESGHVDVHA